MSSKTVTVRARRQRGELEDVLLDESDLPLLSPGSVWILPRGIVCVTRHASKKSGRFKKQTYSLARLILGLPYANGDMVADHIDGNTLDNRRCNLRILTRAQSCQHHSARRFKIGPLANAARGVSWLLRDQRWLASAQVNNVKYRLGSFAEYEDAVKAAEAFRAQHMPYAKE